MPSFTFNYERLLELRNREERDQQLIVAAINRERLAIEQAIRQRQQSITDCKADLRDVLQGGDIAISHHRVNFQSVRLQATASLKLVGDTQQLALQLAGILQRLKAARQALAQSSARRKAVELLKKRRYDQWMIEQRRREAAELDELIVSRAGRTNP